MAVNEQACRAVNSAIYAYVEEQFVNTASCMDSARVLLTILLVYCRTSSAVRSKQTPA